MHIGGEHYELKKRALGDFRVTDTRESLNIRLGLATQLQSAEKVWKQNMVKILQKGKFVTKRD